MMRLLQEHVGREKAVILLREFEAWPKSGNARDPDAMFAGFLRKRGIFITGRAITAARAEATRPCEPHGSG